MEQPNMTPKKPNLNPEPIELGQLKKDSTGSLGFIIIIFMIILAGFLSWPTVHRHLQYSDSWLAGIYARFFGEEEDGQVVINDTRHVLNVYSHIIFDDINISNIRLRSDGITFNIRLLNDAEPINLSEETFYLEISTPDERVLRRVKLTGNINNVNQEKNIVFRPSIQFNPEILYYGRIRHLTEEDYPEVNLGEDNILTCTFDDDVYIYRFENNRLVSLEHNFRARVGADINAHLERMAHYEAIANAINVNEHSVATVSETDFGLEFTANILLNGFIIDPNFKNYFYHQYARSANRVNYQMRGQGFECR